MEIVDCTTGTVYRLDDDVPNAGLLRDVILWYRAERPGPYAETPRRVKVGKKAVSVDGYYVFAAYFNQNINQIETHPAWTNLLSLWPMLSELATTTKLRVVLHRVTNNPHGDPDCFLLHFVARYAKSPIMFNFSIGHDYFRRYPMVQNPPKNEDPASFIERWRERLISSVEYKISLLARASRKRYKAVMAVFAPGVESQVTAMEESVSTAMRLYDLPNDGSVLERIRRLTAHLA